MKKKIASCISVMSHPLLTIPVYVSVVLFANLEFQMALLNSLLIAGGIFVPIAGKMYMGARKEHTQTLMFLTGNKDSPGIFLHPALSYRYDYSVCNRSAPFFRLVCFVFAGTFNNFPNNKLRY